MCAVIVACVDMFVLCVLGGGCVVCGTRRYVFACVYDSVVYMEICLCRVGQTVGSGCRGQAVGVSGTFCLLIIVMVTRVYICVKTLQPASVKWLHLCILYISTVI